MRSGGLVEEETVLQVSSRAEGCVLDGTSRMFWRVSTGEHPGEGGGGGGLV